MWLRCGTLTLAVLLGALPLQAQDRPEQASQVQLDLERLPIDMDRLYRALQQSAERNESDELNVRYTVDVYGQAPKIEWFGDDEDWATGPAPYGAPTHGEMLYQMTPEEFRAPAADLNAAVRWLMERFGKK
jgi:hypothetical protein